jgi:hypothetical protein
MQSTCLQTVTVPACGPTRATTAAGSGGDAGSGSGYVQLQQAQQQLAQQLREACWGKAQAASSSSSSSSRGLLKLVGSQGRLLLQILL